MGFILLNAQSKQRIHLDSNTSIIIGRKSLVEVRSLKHYYGYDKNQIYSFHFAQCNDKRVSRNHGKLTCTEDGKVHLVALHSNPCFFTRNGLPPVLQVNKDEEQILNEGDCLGFLPDSFWFQIISEKSDNTNRRNLNEIKSKISDSLNKETKEEEIHKNHEDLKKKNEESNIIHQNIVSPIIESSTKKNRLGSPEFEKTRRLPLWMYDIDKPNGTKNDFNKKVIYKKSDVWNNFEVDIASQPSTSKTMSSTSKVYTGNRKSINSSNLESTCVHIPEANTLEGNHNYQTQKEDFEHDIKSELQPNDSRRPFCQYEDKCYRKNHQHKLDFCHPGDPDYIYYEDRPMCPYGASCYRKKATHKVEFKHPPLNSDISLLSSSSLSSSHSSSASSPLPAKRRRKMITSSSFANEECENDEIDVEDPFMNDGSSDEYAPSETDLEIYDFDDEV